MNEDCKLMILSNYNYFESNFLDKLLNICKTEYFQKNITRQNNLSVYTENKIDKMLVYDEEGLLYEEYFEGTLNKIKIM